MSELSETRDLIRHTLPLRLDPLLQVAMLLPRDLTKSEAERISIFVKALAL